MYTLSRDFYYFIFKTIFVKLRYNIYFIGPVAHPPAGGGRAGFKEMYSVYVLYNKENNKIYIGQTKDLEERLKLHNEKFFKNSFTSRFKGEWILVYKEIYNTRKEALKREKELKCYRGREFIKSQIRARSSTGRAAAF